MSKIFLRDVFYTPFADEFVDKNIAQSHADIQHVIASHVARIGQHGEHSYADAGHHYFCSTMMDSVFSAHSIDSQQVYSDDLNVPQSFTNAYECACWGYCLRYHVEHKSEQPFLAISILDINSMEMKYWSQNDQWGKSGFGITTLFFEIAEIEQEKQLLHTGMANGGNNIISFASFAKQVNKQCQSDKLSLPFFPDSMSIPVRRSLKDADVLTERHAQYGHAFGSDPWIAFIRDHEHQDLSMQRILFGSLALRGYYCFADVDVPANVNTHHFNQKNDLRVNTHE